MQKKEQTEPQTNFQCLADVLVQLLQNYVSLDEKAKTELNQSNEAKNLATCLNTIIEKKNYGFPETSTHVLECVRNIIGGVIPTQTNQPTTYNHNREVSNLSEIRIDSARLPIIQQSSPCPTRDWRRNPIPPPNNLLNLSTLL